MNDMYFWMGEDSDLNLVDAKTFDALQNSYRGTTKRWQEVDVNPQMTYFFYGILEPDDEQEESDADIEANDQWDDLLNYNG